MSDWLSEHPEVAMVTTVMADLNGQPRGKRMPSANAGKVLKGTARMPLSAVNVDIWGHDIEDSPLVFESGDKDGAVLPTGRGPLPSPWLSKSSAIIPVAMHSDDGNPFPADPRHALQSVLDRYHARGWQVVAATELEFYLVDDNSEDIHPPRSPLSGKRAIGGDVLSTRTLDEFDVFFSDLYQGCAEMGIPADTATSESGLGQFEINLVHGAAMKAAEDAWLFKMLAKGIARKHGLAATFMAKPFSDQPGNGMHVHFSVVDNKGHNVFDDGTDAGTEIMQQAVAGCLAAMKASTLIFAPHANSYERLVPGAHAPTGVAWAYENRTAAIRIPAGPNVARRIEHRVAGGDVNPFLMLATVLGAAITGIEDQLTPPPPLSGNAYDQNLETLPSDWSAAISLFKTDPAMARIFADELIQLFVLTKKQELTGIAKLSETERVALYLESV